MKIPKDWPVQPFKPGKQAKDKATCGVCGLSWDDGKVTSMTPTPSARCPFEAFHMAKKIAPASENKRRIKRAKVALADYIAQDPLSEVCCLTDLLTDLRHWAAHNDVDFIDCLRLSGDHYQAERNGEL